MVAANYSLLADIESAVEQGGEGISRLRGLVDRGGEEGGEEGGASGGEALL